MNNKIDRLRGARVQSCKVDAGSLAVTFDSMKLVVHNKWQIWTVEGKNIDHSALIGTLVTDLITSDTDLRIEFAPFHLIVDLSEGAWVGPEAVILYVNSCPVVVWT